MDKKILQDIKNKLGPMVAEGTGFDQQILGLIETALLPLAQVGCLTDLSESINENTTWGAIIKVPPFDGTSENTLLYSNAYYAIKQYVFIVCKLQFDPPVPTLVPIFESKADELLWRIEAAYNTPVE